MDDGLFGFGYRLKPVQDVGAASLPIVNGSTEDTASGAHYLSPYLTCQKCNNVMMVNVATVSRALCLIPRGGTIPAEVLPVCSDCRSTDKWLVGAHDLSDTIGMNKDQMAKRLQLEKKSALVIQTYYRGYLGRQFARQVREAEAKKNSLEKACATLIENTYRKYDASTRRVPCIRMLELIEVGIRWQTAATVCVLTGPFCCLAQHVHPIVLNRAVNQWREHEGHEGGLIRCFWYKTPQELRLLYANYRLLVTRSGHKPPVYIVEENIREVYRRCVFLLNEYAAKIQKRWRGLVGRRFILIYRSEVVRLREVRAASCYAIQRSFRGWWGIKLVKAQRRKRWKQKIGGDYKKQITTKRARQRQVIKDAHLQARYVKDKEEETMAKYVGKCEWIKGSFKKSAYASKDLESVMATYLVDRSKQSAEAAKQEWQTKRRTEYLKDRADASVFLEKYFQAEKAETTQRIVDTVSKRISPFQQAGRFALERHLLVEHHQSMPNIRDVDPKFIERRSGRAEPIVAKTKVSPF